MKKLKLIIPLAHNSQSQFICCLFILLLGLIPSSLKSQIYGCHVVVGVSDRLYYTPYISGWQTVPTGAITSTGETGGYRNNNTATYGCISDIGGICTVFQQYEVSEGPPQVIGMRVYKTGIYASLDPLNCPLDDLTPFLFLTVGGLAWFFIKQKQGVKLVTLNFL